MSKNIDYVFSVISPWAYIGHALLVDTARQNNCTITYKPVQLLNLFSETGGLPLGKRHPSRQNYRWYEMQRWIEARKIPFNLQPKHWPFSFMLADKTVVAAIGLGHDPAELIHKIMLGIWSNEQDLSDKGTIAQILADCGLPPECLEKAELDETEARYQKNTQDAIDNGCFGSPTYWLNGEMFFGQDKIEQLADALRTGREPYKMLTKV
ncbi:MAG: 2-hydroxychromene-2-carboxylate isomerase [Methyloligellaceae bacterium]